jgi:hypothetical protein
LDKEQTVEHILPKGENTLNDPYWSSQFPTVEGWKANVHSLGNLCLTDHNWNASLGNKPFKLKKGTPSETMVYCVSRFASLRELMQWEDWNEASIEDRQQRIGRFAIERWKL